MLADEWWIPPIAGLFIAAISDLRRPAIPFETWQEVEAVADELDERYRAIPIFATGTGLRPEEWIALERGDVDRKGRLVYVRRRFSGGELKQGTKTVPERAVPLRQRVLDGSIPLPQLATIMGTSIRELEDTYHRWLQRTDERLLAAFDAHDGRARAAG